MAEDVRVLVVEDDEVSREVLGILLAGWGYGVESVNSGEAALAMLRDAPPRYAVLTDWKMPGLAGRELAEELRRVGGAKTPLIVMSASAVSAEVAGAFDGVLRKPFGEAEFRAVMSRVQTGRGVGGSGGGREEESGTGTENVLDEAIYRQLSGSMKAERVAALYAMCLEDARVRGARMELLAAESDERGFRAQAHALKGGTSMVGAAELQELAGRMEAGGVASAGLLQDFVRACERLEGILTARRKAHQGFAVRARGEEKHED